MFRGIATTALGVSARTPTSGSHADSLLGTQLLSNVLHDVAVRNAGSSQAQRFASEYAFDDEGQARNRLKFVSRERKLVPRPPFYRPPIFFPETTLQMMKLTDEQLKQVKETGWTPEVAFKTTPNVTKLEIKGILESMYGMQVERVHTINYLGRKYTTFTRSKRPVKRLWRGDDWKKAYVIFRPPPGMPLPAEQQPSRLGMIEQLLVAKGLVKPQEPAAVEDEVKV